MELKGKARCRFRSKPRWRMTIWSGGRAVHSGRGRANRGACHRLQRPGSQRRQRAGVQAPPHSLGSALHPDRRSPDPRGKRNSLPRVAGCPPRSRAQKRGESRFQQRLTTRAARTRDALARSCVLVRKIGLGRRCDRHLPAALSVPARSRTRPSRLQRGSSAPGRGSRCDGRTRPCRIVLGDEAVALVGTNHFTIPVAIVSTPGGTYSARGSTRSYSSRSAGAKPERW